MFTILEIFKAITSNFLQLFAQCSKEEEPVLQIDEFMG